MRRSIIKIYLWVIAIGGGYWLWGELTGLYLPCFYYSSTGLLCPGCGCTRMFLALSRLQFAEAFSHNPVVLVLLIFWNLIAVLCFWGKPKFLQSKRFLWIALYCTIGILLIFGFLRNFT